MSRVFTDDELSGVRKPIAQAHWLPARAYTDAAVWQAEADRIFRKEWICVGTEKQLGDVGGFFTVTVLEQPLLVVRDASGSVRCFYNTCRHRAMRIAEGAGSAKSFRCPYHHWTYDTQGQLIAAPAMEKTCDFDLADIRLEEVATTSWLGFIFINFSGPSKPLAPELKVVEEDIAPWSLPELEVALEIRFQCDWNWKLMWENGAEGYHVMATHKNSAQLFIPTELSFSTDFDHRVYSDLHHPYVESIPLVNRPEELGPIIAGLPDWIGKKTKFWMIPPSISFYVQPESVTSVNLVPNKQDHCEFVWRYHAPRALTQWSGWKAHLEAIKARIELIQSEDEGPCRVITNGMASGGWTPGRYSHLELPVWQFHQWYAQLMSSDQHED